MTETTKRVVRAKEVTCISERLQNGEDERRLAAKEMKVILGKEREDVIGICDKMKKMATTRR